MIALLANYPIRLKNYAALSIGHSLIKVDMVWWIKLTAAETKEKKADERPIEEYLGDLIDKYIKTYRPILAREKDPGCALVGNGWETHGRVLCARGHYRDNTCHPRSE